MIAPWAGRRVLVTGAGGFIGSHVVDRLVEDGASVRVLLRYTSRGDLGALAWGSAVSELDVRHGDLRDRDAVQSATEGCEAIVHLGALIGVPYSYLAPGEVVETNVLGTLNVLQSARRREVESVTCVSSSEVYGTPDSVPITETHALRAQSPYAASKIGADMLALSFHASFGLPVGLVRPFNTYGPRQSARAVIPTLITQALAGGPVRLGGVESVRDFTYVEDTVRGLLAFAAWPEAPGAVVQLGTGVAVSIVELVALVGEVLGRSIDVETDRSRIRPRGSEVERLVSDPSAARERLGWASTVALREGVERTAAWLESNLALYRPEAYAV